MKKPRERSQRGGSKSKIQLRVAEAKHRDIGKRRARINPNSMREIGVEPGEIVQLIGKRSSPVIACAADEDQQNSGIIRIDGQTRKNVGVSLNDLLSIRKIESKHVILYSYTEGKVFAVARFFRFPIVAATRRKLIVVPKFCSQ